MRRQRSTHVFFVMMLASIGLMVLQCSAATTRPTQEAPRTTDGGLNRDRHPNEPTPKETPKPDHKTTESHKPEKAPETTTTFSPSQFPKPGTLASSDHSFTSKHFSGSGNCSNCHNGLNDKSGNDVSIVNAWSSTMMANATRDPLWQAKVETEIQRNPKYKTLITEKCTRCHAPMANFEAKSAKENIDLFGPNGFLNPANKHFHQAMDGVSCTTCHQIKPTPALGTLAGFSGKFVIESFNNPVDRKIYGPYTDIVEMPMRNMVSYTPTGSPHIRQSTLCASCHNLKTPYLDAKGNVIPKTPEQEFPEQMIYTEWLHSDFSKNGQHSSCQSCHMANATGVVIASRPPWLNTPRDHFGQHIFVGGNRFMLQMMKDNSALLGITANNFDFTLKKTTEMLASAARLEITQKSYTQGTLKFQVKVTNLSGHKLPSGYPSRRVFLHAIVKDSSGTVLFESGKQTAYGQIVGVDADQQASQFEAHHDTITSPSQVQVYEAIMGNTDGKVTYTLLRGAQYLKDNRLLPKGFPKGKAPSDIAVAGKAIKDTNFVAGQDRVNYQIDKLKATKLTIELHLRYQTMSYRFARDLLDNAQGTATKKFGYLYLRAPRYSEPIASTSFSL